MMEGILGNSERESFMIEEVKSPKESEGENVWLYVMVGIGLAYFLFWRFQIRKLMIGGDASLHVIQDSVTMVGYVCIPKLLFNLKLH